MFRIIQKIFSFAGNQRKLLLKAILIAFLGAMFSALQFSALLMTVDALVKSGSTIPIWSTFFIMLLSIAGRAACFYYSANAETKTGFYMVAEKRIHIGDRLRYIPMGYFNQNSLGDITATVTTTLGDVENTAARCLVMILGGLLNTTVLCLALSFIDLQIAFVAILGVLLYLLATELSQNAVSKAAPERQRAQEALIEAVLEYIQGMGVVKAYGLEKDNGQTINKAVNRSCRNNLALTYSAVPWSAIRYLTARLFSIAILIFTLYLYFIGGITLPRCLMVLIASYMIYQELESAGNMSDNLQMLGTSMDKANMIDDTPIMDTDGIKITTKEASLTFCDVSFSYGNRKILDHVNISVPENTMTAIVGPSGSGKTTLCNLIARFWDVDGGRIMIGDMDIRMFKLDSLMKNISMVFQDVFLFADSIENNIKFGRPEATHEQVIEAAQKACCHDFIMALPDEYNTVIGEGGGTLSGGEKQRISIARAILKDAPIIILDEATSSVDPENEDELQRAIETLTYGKTIIMIAHRLKTVRRADQILVLNHAHIVQRGTHAELVQQKGLYADFVAVRQESIGWKLAQ